MKHLIKFIDTVRKVLTARTAVTMFISMPDAPLVKFLSLFPLTSPIPLMLRNAAGNLGLGEATLSIALVFFVLFFDRFKNVRESEICFYFLAF